MTQINQEDQILINQALDGNLSAVLKLLKNHEKLYTNYLIRMTGGPGDNFNKIYREIHLEIIKSLHTFDLSYCFSIWILKIAHNLCVDNFETKINTDNFSLEKIDRSVLKAKLDDFDTNCVDEKIREIIFELIMLMSNQYRSFFLLRYYCMLSSKEISLISNIPYETTKSRISASRNMLKKLIF